MRLPLALILFCIISLVASVEVTAETVHGLDVEERFEGSARVVDGDGLVVTTDDGDEREVRLQGIDAPEIAQHCEDEAGVRYACGLVAKERLAALVEGRRVACATPADDPEDAYGRALAFCAVDGVDINLTLLRDGHAIVYRRFVLAHPTEGRRAHADAFLAAEHEARAARRGLWSGLFTPPWEFRAARRATRDR